MLSLTDCAAANTASMHSKLYNGGFHQAASGPDNVPTAMLVVCDPSEHGEVMCDAWAAITQHSHAAEPSNDMAMAFSQYAAGSTTPCIHF